VRLLDFVLVDAQDMVVEPRLWQGTDDDFFGPAGQLSLSFAGSVKILCFRSPHHIVRAQGKAPGSFGQDQNLLAIDDQARVIGANSWPYVP